MVKRLIYILLITFTAILNCLRNPQLFSGEVLIHEIVGHAAPTIVDTETGNAVENENIVRRELKLPERIEEEKHHE